MSYILDALRRADAERERGTLPGLHTQAVPAGTSDSDEERPPRPWGWIAAASIAVLSVAAWWFMGRADTPDPAAAVAVAPPPPIPAAAIAPAAPAPPGVAPLATPPAVAGISGATAPTVAPSASSAALPVDVGAPAAQKPAAVAAAAPTRKPPASAVAAARSAARADARPADNKASEPEARPPLLSQLPEEVRRGLPSITIGGSIYSKSAANRMLVINGQVFHEGDELMPALVLEQIKQKAAVLNFKGFRYEVGY